MNERKYTQFDWATDRKARENWAELENDLFERIDKKRLKRTNYGHKRPFYAPTDKSGAWRHH